MKILAIETSCDETGISIIDANGDFKDFSCEVIANELLSQASMHAEYGGVFPNLAKREHAKSLVPLLQSALANMPTEQIHLDDAQIEKIKEILEREPELFVQLVMLLSQNTKPNIDAIAVTYGPGLAPALWVGVNFARVLALAWNVPLVAVNHMEGHIFSAMLQSTTGANYKLSAVSFPAISLLISGGHTQLILAKDLHKYELLGQTRDDAVGEAFDKVARLLGLPYPGGPQISKLAQMARNENLSTPYTLPRPMIDTSDYDFSFSGLKTAVLTLTKKLGELSNTQKKQIAKEFEDATADVLLAKTTKALADTGAQTLILGGGVSANSHISNTIVSTLNNEFANVSLLTPTPELTGDNSLMIAVAAYFRLQGGEHAEVAQLEANANLTLY